MGQGKLFVVATPIGNLEDITLRALNVLKEVDFIISEKTEKTLHLLNHYGIKKKVLHFSQRLTKPKLDSLLSEVEMGKSAALVVEAGTPGISDPGEELIREAIAKGLEVIPIPGPSAITCALSASGAPIGRGFVFLGFPPLKKSKREKFFSEIKNFKRTTVIFESPHRLLKTLKEIESHYPDAKVVIMKEMTKKFEKRIAGKIEEVLEKIKNEEIRGEYTIIIWFD